VIDVLNMDEQMIHHYNHYGFFSPAIDDYKNFNILQNIQMDDNQELGKIVDPYTYLRNGRFDDMPKLVMNSSGDEFFVPDSSQYYFGDLPGTQNYLRYIPNTGHGLNSSAGTSTLSFYDAVVNNRTLPQYSWTVGQDGAITVSTTSSPTNVVMWQATNPSSRDFRNAYTGIVWSSTPLANQGSGGTAVYVANPGMPASGATAYFIQLTFPSALAGNPYVFTTQVNIKTNLPYTPWAFYTASNDPPAALALVQAGDDEAALLSAANPLAGMGDVVRALALRSIVDEPAAAIVACAPLSLAAPAPVVAVEAALANFLMDDVGWGRPDDSEEAESGPLELMLDEFA
jgi:PhoPQ-activated pathogenicity-related protein